MHTEINLKPLAVSERIQCIEVPPDALPEALRDDYTFPGFYDTPFGNNTFARLTPKHVRSFVAKSALELSIGSNIYSSLSVKGSYFPDVPRRRAGLDDGIAEVYGQADESDLKCVPNSLLISNLGLPTEAIIATSQLDEALLVSRAISMSKYKKQLYDIEERNPGSYSSEYLEWLATAKFYGIVRLTEVGGRLDDFNDKFDLPTNFRIVEEMVGYRNLHAKMLGEPAISHDDSAAIQRLVSQILPKRIGQSLAILHNAGYVHGNPHSGNWLTSGTFMDTESLHIATEEDRISEEHYVKTRISRRIEHITRLLMQLGLVCQPTSQSEAVSHIEAGMDRATDLLIPFV